MGHPDYVYTPWSDRRRAAASDAAKARFGLRSDQRMLYGVPLPEEVFWRVSPIIYRIAQRFNYMVAQEAVFAFAARGVWALRPYMRDTPMQTRGRIMRRRERLIVQRKAEERVKAQILAKLDRIMQAAERRRERELMAEEDRLERGRL